MPTNDDDANAVERVGPVFSRGPVAEALVAAIRASNPDAEVIDRGAYLRVLVPGRCRLVRADVEHQLGRPFHLPGDLEEVMPSFKGALVIDDREVFWTTWRRPA
jgi:MmoB/DmpM family